MEPASPEACAELRARLRLPAQAPLILHVGRNFYKNRETVLDVAAWVRTERPDVHLVMVGALTPALAAQAERLGLGRALHVLDRVAREDMATLYTTAAVLLFPSHYEGFGLPVLEAQMCGTPVVCSDRGALPEVTGDSSTFVSETDVHAYASAATSAINAILPYRTNSQDAKADWMSAHAHMYTECETTHSMTLP